MKDEIQDYMHRPKRYDNIDGTGEIFMGLMLLAFALIGYLQGTMPEHSFWQRHGLMFMYGVLAPFLGLGWLIQKLVKRNITFPRTGYVARGSADRPLATKMKSWFYCAVVGPIIGLIVLGIFALLAHLGRSHPFGLSAAFSLSTGRIVYAALFIGIYGFWINRMGQGQSWKWAILILVAAGMITAGMLVPIHDWRSDPFKKWVMLLAGASWVLSGAGTLIGYLRHHQITATE